jgi:Uma2 family endonuclease
LPDPVVLVEVLSPSNEIQTRANVWAYTTIPSVQEILIVFSTEIGAELLRRRPDGSWPDQPELIGPDGELRLEAIGLTPLRDAYRSSGLV